MVFLTECRREAVQADAVVAFYDRQMRIYNNWVPKELI